MSASTSADEALEDVKSSAVELDPVPTEPASTLNAGKAATALKSSIARAADPDPARFADPVCSGGLLVDATTPRSLNLDRFGIDIWSLVDIWRAFGRKRSSILPPMRTSTLLAALCAPAAALAFVGNVPSTSISQLAGASAISRHVQASPALRSVPAASRLRMAGGPAEATESKAPSALVSMFKEEMADWGLVRWILVNPSGSVLETTAEMGMGTNLFTIPGKGTYCTVASADKLFESRPALPL